MNNLWENNKQNYLFQCDKCKKIVTSTYAREICCNEMMTPIMKVNDENELSLSDYNDIYEKQGYK